MQLKFLAFLTIVFLFNACGPRKVVESKYPNGNPSVVKYYEKINGKEHLVKEEVYYENKVKKMEGEYTNNLRSGQWTVWYEDGKLWSEGVYKDGKRNGPGLVYHPNGKKYIESNYKDDLKSGTWHFYDTSGKVLKTVNFDIRNAATQLDTLNNKMK